MAPYSCVVTLVIFFTFCQSKYLLVDLEEDLEDRSSGPAQTPRCAASKPPNCGDDDCFTGNRRSGTGAPQCMACTVDGSESVKKCKCVTSGIYNPCGGYPDPNGALQYPRCRHAKPPFCHENNDCGQPGFGGHECRSCQQGNLMPICKCVIRGTRNPCWGPEDRPVLS